tara:strand:- start:1810 stop:2043 length:234 start_codon:yes stop_codon:yes gene_type:complete
MTRTVDGIERISRRLDRTIERIDAIVDSGKYAKSDVELRDYFAMNAISISSEFFASPPEIANFAYCVADAMMEVRKK